MTPKYALGLDFGTNSARCLIVNVQTGREVGTAVAAYRHGESGILIHPRYPDLARQHPADYLESMVDAVDGALNQAIETDRHFSPAAVVGIGVDATGSTPLPVDANGNALGLEERFELNLSAMAWLWKDHTATEEAAAITARAAEIRPHYLAKCGGIYSSEWFFSKIWRCLKVDPTVYSAAHTWVELADWIPAILCGTQAPDKLKRGICAAGHKGLFHKDWGGYPDKQFLGALAPELADLRDRLPDVAYSIDTRAGELSSQWAEKLGLLKGIPVAIGAIDAHLGAVGAGIKEGRLVKIIGTSTCDMMVWPEDRGLANIPGLCGIVPGSILPRFHGIEAGQSAVGDIFNWFVNYIQPGGPVEGSHEALTKRAEALKPGESGLLALDWNNGNRCTLVDQRLTGLLLGQTLHTRPEEIYRALVEATAFGALKIIRRLEEFGVRIDEVINCGGIAEKNPMVMQIYADITGRPMKVSRSAQTCALGAAMCGAVAAGKAKGGHDTFDAASAAMTGVKDVVYQPDHAAHAVYEQLFDLYSDLYGAFGTIDGHRNLHQVMKRLIEIRTAARA